MPRVTSTSPPTSPVQALFSRFSSISATLFSFSSHDSPPSPSPPSDPVSFQIMSDLHLEYPSPDEETQEIDSYCTFTIPRKAPYLILAGDVGLLVHYSRYLGFLRRQTEKFDRVFLVLGNHEFYRASREQGLTAARKMEAELAGKLVLLEKGRWDCDEGNVTILGSTMHSFIPPEQEERVARAVNDFHLISGWNTKAHNAAHKADKEWLKKELKKIAEEDAAKKRRVLVVSHHAPDVVNTSAPIHERSPLGSAFCSEILKEMRRWTGKERVAAWVFGHTHWGADFWDSGIRVVANQRGYWYDKTVRKNFDIGKVLDV
ncbi:hypothetical protein RUND412_011096 [Rhizina undulata]